MNRTAVLVLASAVRVTALIGASQLPFFRHHRLDALVYHRAGQSIAAGDWGLGTDVLHLSPLYSYLLGILYTLFGDGPWAIRIVQLALGVLTVALIMVAARTLVSERWTSVAGLVAALYGPFLFYEVQLSVATLAACLNAALLCAILRAVHDQRSVLPWVLVGVVWGLGVLARPNALVWALPIALAIGLGLRERPIRQRLGALVAAGLVMIVVVSPITLRNGLVAGEWVAVTDSGGLNFYIGNGPGAIGTFRVPEGVEAARNAPAQFEAFREVAQTELGRPLSSQEVDRFWYERSLDAISDDPGAWLEVLVRKAWLFWSARELPNTHDYGFWRQIHPLLALAPIQFGWLAPLALLGTLLLFRRRQPERLVVGSAVVVLMGALVLFFVLSHYRLPAVPLLILAAIYGLSCVVDWARRRAWPQLVGGGVIVGLSAMLTAWPQLEIPFDEEYFKLAYAHHRLGELPQAAAAYEEALTINPDHLSALKNLALLHESRGDVAAAVRTWVRLGESADRQGRADYEAEARRHLEQLGVLPPAPPQQ